MIFIPNEAHESLNQPEDQYPLVNQAYLPQNAIVNSGTMVIWFNGDVDHDHKVSLINDRNPDSVYLIVAPLHSMRHLDHCIK